MRYTEFNPLISEAPMNPGEFNKAIDTGHTKGVLVGFEFECVVPKLTIRGAPEPEPEKQEGRTKASVAQIISNDNIFSDLTLKAMPAKKFDELFRFIPGKSKYANMTEAVTAFSVDRLAVVKELFNKIPEKIRIKAIPLAKERAANRRTWQPEGLSKQMIFAYNLGKVLVNNFSTRRSGGGSEIEYIGSKIYQGSSGFDLEDVLAFAFGTPGRYDVEAHLLDYLDFDPEAVYTAMNLDEYEEYDDEMHLDNDSEDDDYAGATTVLKPALEQTMGRKVTVFKRYHERPKNMTDWYIEPDGSLIADNDGDGTAEVVSPPLPAKDAVTALKNFFAMAAKMGIYTNNSTGLHINVSIPDTLDILKLAVFTGDQYVLKNFNRLNSDYAQSVTRDIPKSVDGDAITIKQGPKKDKNVFGQRKQTTEINTKMIQKIAREISDDHMASISYNGKWVSFRHTGGNYLKDYTEIYNVVGRFVRAIIIASDPTMYQNEYKAAIAKIATPQDLNPDSLQSTLNYISTKGLPVIEVHIAFKGAGVMNPKAMFKKVCDFSSSLPDYSYMKPEQLTFIPNSPQAKQKMLEKSRDNGPFKEWADTATPDKFVTVIYSPINEFQIGSILRREISRSVVSTYGRGGNRNGFYAMDRSVIPATDIRARKMMLDIRKEYYRDKQQKAALQARAR